MANWFIALPVAAGSWFERVSGAPEGVRVFHPDDLHLTIAFLGNVGRQRALSGWAALRWPLGPIDVTLGPVVPMGDPRRPSAMSAVLVRGREEVEAAMWRCRDKALEAAGARAETRPPKAHLTVARPPRDATRAERERTVRWAAALDLGEPTVTLDRVALYTWSADRTVRQFDVVEERCAVRT